MKKNKKGFMQNEANLEKVSGGLFGVNVETKMDDVQAKIEPINSKKIQTNQKVKGNHDEVYNMSTNYIY